MMGWLDPQKSPQITDPELIRMAVIGAGPTALEAALYARYLGYPAWIFSEQAWAVPDDAQRTELPADGPLAEWSSTLGRAALSAHQPDSPLPPPNQTLTLANYWQSYWVPLAQSDLLASSWRNEHRLLSAEPELASAEIAGEVGSSAAVDGGEILIATDDDSDTGWPAITQPYAVAPGDREWLGPAWRLEFGTPAGNATYWFDWVLFCSSAPTAAQLPQHATASSGWFALGPAAIHGAGATPYRLADGLVQIRELFAWLGGRANLDLYRSFAS